MDSGDTERGAPKGFTGSAADGSLMGPGISPIDAAVALPHGERGRLRGYFQMSLS
jgi:hypothetical protein